jgi:hypothetical protein
VFLREAGLEVPNELLLVMGHRVPVVVASNSAVNFLLARFPTGLLLFEAQPHRGCPASRVETTHATDGQSAHRVSGTRRSAQAADGLD